jgi:hypothetical protein
LSRAPDISLSVVARTNYDVVKQRVSLVHASIYRETLPLHVPLLGSDNRESQPRETPGLLQCQYGLHSSQRPFALGPLFLVAADFSKETTINTGNLDEHPLTLCSLPLPSRSSSYIRLYRLRQQGHRSSCHPSALQVRSRQEHHLRYHAERCRQRRLVPYDIPQMHNYLRRHLGRRYPNLTRFNQALTT